MAAVSMADALGVRGLCPVLTMRVPLILQSRTSECGLAALTMIANHFGHDLDLTTMRRRFGDERPDLRSMVAIANSLGLIGRPLRLGISDMRKLALPAVLHWEFDHFVVVTKVSRRRIVIHDPAAGRRVLDWTQFGDAFTGVAVEFTRARDFARQSARQLPSVSGLMTSFRGLPRYLLAMLFLLVATQLLSLAPPVATQLLIDEVVLGQDRLWLHRVIVGLALVMLAAVLIDTLRRRIALYTGMRIASDSTTLFIRHLLQLPAATIGRRSVGDLMSRVDSMQPLRVALTETSLRLVVQGTVMLATLVLMLVYSRLLTAVSLGAVIVITLLHALVLPRSRGLNAELVASAARAGNSLIESLRAYPAVNAMGLGPQRLAHWQHGFATAINAETRKQKLVVITGAGQGVITVFEYALFLAVGIGGVLDGQFTLGVLFAFLSLRGTLMTAAIELLGAVRQLYLVRTHVERVAEIVAETPEADPPRHALRQPLRGRIACEALVFRYPGGPLILDGFTAAIDAGESVVIRGASGSGKSTLLRLLAGSLDVDGGRLRYDAIDARLWDRGVLRRQFGIVLQSDRLFEGSVADNISCFEPGADVGRLRAAAELAAIWDDIQELPMTIHTPLAGANGGLSGGQAQRLLLARAIYRQPRVLFLDEATSQLDHATERRVIDNLGTLNVTTISVAHRNNALAAASRFIDLGNRQPVAFGP
jgi:ATP-binding cassette, subfamily B, bacterial CvaB/MchF/RaxB